LQSEDRNDFTLGGPSIARALSQAIGKRGLMVRKPQAFPVPRDFLQLHGIFLGILICPLSAQGESVTSMVRSPCA